MNYYAANDSMSNAASIACLRRSIEPPLLRFLRTLDPQMKIRFATQCGTTLQYLQQLCGKSDPNPSLRLSKALITESEQMVAAFRAYPSGPIFIAGSAPSPLTFDDLLVGRVKLKRTKEFDEKVVIGRDRKVLRRRLDSNGHIVWIDADSNIVEVEDTAPSMNAKEGVPALEVFPTSQ